MRVEILESTRSISSSVFLAAHVLRPFLSRMFTMSQWSAFAPARFTQQSKAIRLPQNTTSKSLDMLRVGNAAPSNQSHFLFRMSGLRQSSSVSKSSTRMQSGRTASFRVPRGLSPAPNALKAAPLASENSLSVHEPNSLRSP